MHATNILYTGFYRVLHVFKVPKAVFRFNTIYTSPGYNAPSGVCPHFIARYNVDTAFLLIYVDFIVLYRQGLYSQTPDLQRP